MNTLRKTAILLVAGVLLGPVAAGAAEVDVPEELRGAMEEVHMVKREISLLNLLNGLYLSPEQLDELIVLAREAEEIRGGFFERAAGQADAYITELSTLRDALYTTTGPSPGVNHAAVEMEHAVEMDPLREVSKQLGALEDQARQVLGDGQAAIIEGFEPCLIPPKDLRDPVAVGQASTTQRQEEALDIIRRMPASLYNERKEEIADTIVAMGEHEKGKMPADVRANMLATLVQKMDDIRHMDGVDFEMQRRELGESFVLFDDDETYYHGKRELGKISRYLLNGHAAGILEKYRQARAKDPASVELAAETNPAPEEQFKYKATQAAQHFGRLTLDMLRERHRAGALPDSKARELHDKLFAARDMTDPEEQLDCIIEVADHLNQAAITESSVRSMFFKVAILAHEKRVPGLGNPHHHRRPPIEFDITGLQGRVEEARAAAKEGHVQQAYGLLDEVARCLAEFEA